MTGDENLYGWFRDGFAEAFGDPFLTVPGRRTVTYGQMDDRSAQYAAALSACGVRPGDRVTVQVDKSIEAVALYLATLRVGAVYMPLNPAYTSREVRFFLEDAEPSLFVHRPGHEPAGVTVPTTHTLTADGGSLSVLADSLTPDDRLVPRAGGDLAAMLYTSGTTGRSKGAMLTIENLRSNAAALHAIWGFEPGDVVLHILPIFHVHGLFVALHTAMRNASHVWFLPRFDEDGVLDHLGRSTVMMGVPTHYRRLLSHDGFDAEAARSIRLFTSGSAPMTETTHARFTDRTGHRILERYGMTECGMITSNPLNGDRIPGTVGHPLPDVEIRVVTGDGVAAPGESGVVQVAGPNVFAGYWRLPEKTTEEFDGRWFTTGDVGHLSTDGRLTLAGRAADMIISGGLNVYPRELELVIDQVDGVSESAVVGAPHADLGETPVAFVVGEAIDIDRISQAVSTHLASFKKPTRYIEVDELPRNAMGKIQKADLRRRIAD